MVKDRMITVIVTVWVLFLVTVVVVRHNYYQQIWKISKSNTESEYYYKTFSDEHVTLTTDKRFNQLMEPTNTQANIAEPHVWQIKVISFSKQLSLLSVFNSLFPGVDTSIQEAVDFREISEDKLFKNNLISMSAYLSMTGGRKWDREVNSIGAVGLAQANRIALLSSNDSDKSVLLCEDDCIISKPEQFVYEINQLLNNTSLFDLAVFGIELLEETESHLDPVPFMPAGWYYLDTNSHFWMTHCVLYTPEGRRKVGEYLKNEKLEMQIDGLYSYMNKLGIIKVIVQVTNRSAVQKAHVSSVQTDNCPICLLKPNAPRGAQNIVNSDRAYVITIGIIVLIMLSFFLFKKNID